MRTFHPARPMAKFLTVFVLFPLLSVAQDPNKAPTERKAWRYSEAKGEGTIVNDRGTQWTETRPDGTKSYFEEVMQTDTYVELRDPSRGISLRLHADHGEWHLDNKPDWNRWNDGRWIATADLPAAPKMTAADYKVRLAYFVPSDRKPVPRYEEKIRVVMQFVAELYRVDLQAKGYKISGLSFESKGNRPVVHLVRGTKAAGYYNGAPNFDTQQQWKRILAEVPDTLAVPSRDLLVIFAETLR